MQNYKIRQLFGCVAGLTNKSIRPCKGIKFKVIPVSPTSPIWRTLSPSNHNNRHLTHESPLITAPSKKYRTLASPSAMHRMSQAAPQSSP